MWGFETLTSEQLRPGGGDKEVDGKHDNGGGSALYRKRGRVYPETGCALDNLTLCVSCLFLVKRRAIRGSTKGYRFAAPALEEHVSRTLPCSC